jgi:hypothetical protein
VVEHSTHNPGIEDSNQVAGHPRREKMEKSFFFLEMCEFFTTIKLFSYAEIMFFPNILIVLRHP